MEIKNSQEIYHSLKNRYYGQTEIVNKKWLNLEDILFWLKKELKDGKSGYMCADDFCEQFEYLIKELEEGGR